MNPFIPKNSREFQGKVVDAELEPPTSYPFSLSSLLGTPPLFPKGSLSNPLKLRLPKFLPKIPLLHNPRVPGLLFSAEVLPFFDCFLPSDFLFYACWAAVQICWCSCLGWYTLYGWDHRICLMVVCQFLGKGEGSEDIGSFQDLCTTWYICLSDWKV